MPELFQKEKTKGNSVTTHGNKASGQEEICEVIIVILA
jgi:hypothetical protein